MAAPGMAPLVDDTAGAQARLADSDDEWEEMIDGIDLDEYAVPCDDSDFTTVPAGEPGKGTTGPTIVPTSPPRFDAADTKGYLDYLDEHGYCVIAEAADPSAVATGKRLLWDFLESGDPDGRHLGDVETEILRDDISTWGDDRWGCKVSMPESGILGSGGIGHSAFLWHSRLQPAVRAVFSAIWGTESLLTSFDGANAFRPWAENLHWITEGGWYHVDQGKTRPDKCCVQGVLQYTDATAASGGLVVIPGSHKDFLNVVERNSKFSSHDFVSLSAWDPVLAGTSAALVCARAGDLLLWDSRTVHCNTPGLSPPPTKGTDGPAAAAPTTVPPELLRMAAYICMTPAKWATEKVLARRRAAYEYKMTTTHWPHTFSPTGDGLLDIEGRKGAFARASAEARALIDGGIEEAGE